MIKQFTCTIDTSPNRLVVQHEARSMSLDGKVNLLRSLGGINSTMQGMGYLSPSDYLWLHHPRRIVRIKLAASLV